MDRGVSVEIKGFSKKKPVDGQCYKAETLGIYNVDSEKRGVAYMYAEDEIAILTCRGYLRMTVETAECMVKELTGLIEDIKDLRRIQCQK